MSDYQVFWPSRRWDELLAIIEKTLSGPPAETAAINQALREIEEQLRRTPLSAGESRTGDQRIHFVPPIAVDFVVFPAERSVLVLQVHYSRGRRS